MGDVRPGRGPEPDRPVSTPGPASPVVYPTQFRHPPVWHLAVVIAVELVLAALAVVVWGQHWLPVTFTLIPLIALFVGRWWGSSRPVISPDAEHTLDPPPDT